MSEQTAVQTVKQPEEKLAVVQFTHPGKEACNEAWNTGDHRRKFLRSSGTYVNKSGKPAQGDLVFWGEWEPPSDFTPLDNNNDTLYPTRLHTPFIPKTFPAHGNPCGGDGACGDNAVCNDDGCQNTDPFVFGACFRYAICKQRKYTPAQNTRAITQLARLKKGSLILFGSTKGKTEKDAFFMLDTVFVVGSFVPGDKVYTAKEIDKTYRRVVLDMTFPDKSYPQDMRVYSGATFKDPVEGMYSFAPARIYGKGAPGFPRVALKDLPYITNNLNSAPKVTDCGDDISKIKEAWNTIVEISRKQDRVEGVQFEMPPLN